MIRRYGLKIGDKIVAIKNYNYHKMIGYIEEIVKNEIIKIKLLGKRKKVLVAVNNVIDILR